MIHANTPIKVILYGLGPIGLSVARLALQKQTLQVVGAVDIDPVKVGRDLGDLLELEKAVGITVTNDVQALLTESKPDLALHTTRSALSIVYPQIARLVEAGVNVVSSAEELFFPIGDGTVPAQKLDALAREHGVSVLGTGVNPGFVMDLLPLALTSPCQSVHHIRVIRVVDAASRRLPLQQKVGVGLTREAFDERVAQGRMGHVGLPESLAFLAHNLGWTLERAEDSIEPVVAEAPLVLSHRTVPAGRVLGIHQTATGYRNGEAVIELDLWMHAGAENPQDRITISGVPALDVVIQGGTPGDLATAPMLVNAVPHVLRARPGLLTAHDLPVVGLLSAQSMSEKG